MQQLKLIRRYGFRGSVKLLADILNTKLFFSPCRIIRRPYYIRGKRFIKFGKGFTGGAIVATAIPRLVNAVRFAW